MDRNAVIEYAREYMGAEPEYLWERYPTYCVLRHSGNKKWFALLADVQKKKLGLTDDGTVEILNVKCDGILLGSLLGRKGFLPAYHMSKSSWVTILLDGSADDEEIISLLNLSYELTNKR